MAKNADFCLSAPLPVPIKRSKRERQAIKLATIQAKELARKTRERQQEEKKHQDKSKAQKVPTVMTVSHSPTYSVVSFKRADGLKENRKPPSAFVTKNEIQSTKSMTRLKNAVNWMLLFADKKRVFSKKDNKSFYFRLAFITLTLPSKQQHPDEVIKEKCLQPFLLWLHRYYNSLYVWKAESQLNGNIHFHITIDTYVPWKSIRAKWNKLTAKLNYCKVFQDGTNDRGDAATQIKAVLSEKKCANDIGGYMSKKDQVHKKDIAWFKKWLHDGGPIPKAYEDANVHCKFDAEKQSSKQDTTWYKRVIDGRLWGCSEALSKIKIFLDEHDCDFKKEETIFFRQNDDIYNLGKTVIQREKQKYAKTEIAERQVRRLTDEDIEHRYRFMENVFIHPHLSMMKKGGTLQKLIHEEKLKRKKNNQKYFTEN